MPIRLLVCPGACIEDAEVPHDIDEELALKMYETMVKLQTMDVIFYEAQRQVLLLSKPLLDFSLCIFTASLHGRCCQAFQWIYPKTCNLEHDQGSVHPRGVNTPQQC